MIALYIVTGFIALLVLYLYVSSVRQDKKLWNDGISKNSGKPWRRYSTGRSSTRAYTDDVGNYIWIEHKVDKNYVEPTASEPETVDPDPEPVPDEPTQDETAPETVAEDPSPDEEGETTDEDTDLSYLKVSELKALAKEKKLTGYSKMKKAELVELLSN